MKVICIDKLWVEVPENMDRPICMNTYNVDGQNSYLNFGMYYHLEEFEGDKWWNSDKFIPISNIDETELIKEKEQGLCDIM